MTEPTHRTHLEIHADMLDIARTSTQQVVDNPHPVELQYYPDEAQQPISHDHSRTL